MLRSLVGSEMCIRDRCREGRLDGEGDYSGKQREIKSIDAEEWVKRYAGLNGDQAPDQAKIFLPSCSTKADLFVEYEAEMVDLGKEPLSKSHFYKVWKEFCSDIVIPEVMLLYL